MADLTIFINEKISLDNNDKGIVTTQTISNISYVDNRTLNITSGSVTTLFSLSNVNGAGRFTFSTNQTSSGLTSATVASASYAELNFDVTLSQSVHLREVKKLTVALSTLPSYDGDGVRAFYLTSGSITIAKALPAFTAIVGSNLNFYVTASSAELVTG